MHYLIQPLPLHPPKGGGARGRSFPNTYQGDRLPDGNFSAGGNSASNISQGRQSNNAGSGNDPGGNDPGGDDNDPNNPTGGGASGPPFPRPPGGNNINQNSSRSLSLGFDQKQRIAISNHFGSLPKFKDVSNAYLIYRHIKDFVNNYKIIDISNYPLDFQILIFLTTFAGSAKQLIEPFFDHTHVIYSLPNMADCLKMVKELFCSQFQRQALRRHYDNFKLKNNNYRVFLSQKLDMFLSINDIYVIPSVPHNPPHSVNMLFEH